MNLHALIARAEADCAPVFARRDEVERAVFARVLASLQNERIATRHFAATTGYGYDDIGRDALSRVFASVLGCEAALVRPQIVSGTHAIALCLFGLLRPGDTLLAGVGKPYDTLETVIGIGSTHPGSLRELGVAYEQVELLPDGKPDVQGILHAITEKTRVLLLQRSRGYAWRPSLTPGEIGDIARATKAVCPGLYVVVDNCYGEFVCEDEPSGVDILVGSLIKNPGGGLAPTGGYIAGTAEAVERISYRLTAPGIGAEVGSYAGGYQPFFQGLFMAPHIVSQAVKGAILTARVMALLGFDVQPAFDAERTDIIQAVKLLSEARLITFCEGIQAASPIDSFALPEPWDMPGYQHQVIMAAGTFVSGASIELSADAPVKDPYIVYLQGGLTYMHVRYAVETAVQRMMRKGLLDPV